jgi:FkbM family methyltransferase
MVWRSFAWHLQLRYQLVRRRLASVQLLEKHIGSWWLWLHLCAWNAESVAQGIGRRSESGLTFVQIGANDGVLNDPIHDTVVRHRWRGLLVEPIPWIFDKLIENYRGVDGLEFENAAIAPIDGTMTMFYVERQPGDPDFFDQLFTFDEATIRSHHDAAEDFDSRVRQTDVRGLTLSSMLKQHHIGAVDVLHIDAEGFDLEILKQIDFAAPWAPRFILFEVKHLSQDSYRAARALLRHAGYRFFPIWHDAFAYRGAPQRRGSKESLAGSAASP